MKSEKQVLRDFLQALEKLGFLESAHVIAEDEGKCVVVVADKLSREGRIRLWDLEWSFVDKYPDFPFLLELVERRGRPLSDLRERKGNWQVKTGFREVLQRMEETTG